MFSVEKPIVSKIPTLFTHSTYPKINGVKSSQSKVTGGHKPWTLIKQSHMRMKCMYMVALMSNSFRMTSTVSILSKKNGDPSTKKHNSTSRGNKRSKQQKIIYN